jgi:PAS domain S-box-containing protein
MKKSVRTKEQLARGARVLEKQGAERGQLEAELVRSEEKYRSLVNNVPLGIFRSTPGAAGVFLEVNPAMEKIFGYSREELLRMKVSDLYMRPKDRVSLTGQLASSGQVKRELSQRRKDGSEVIILATITGVRDEEGKVKYFDGINEDITERKRLERELGEKREQLEAQNEELQATEEELRVSNDELQAANEELHREVAERKRAEEELEQTMAALKQSNTELQNFAYVASHDLQEPLRMVSSFTQLLAKRYQDKLDSDADDFIGYAVEGANRMQRLISDLLEYSRVTTRGRPFVPTDAGAVFEQATNNLRLAIDEARAVVTCDPLPPVMADDMQMVQLFQNLIGNAVKFRGREPPRVHVSAKQEGEEWVFSVRDNGVGIEPQYFDRVFIIFKRLHSREDYPGTGAGLAVCKNIVERHGGRIWVESEPGKGSTFYFTIPLTRG